MVWCKICQHGHKVGEDGKCPNTGVVIEQRNLEVKEDLAITEIPAEKFDIANDVTVTAEAPAPEPIVEPVDIEPKIDKPQKKRAVKKKSTRRRR